ncbi:hypothetical protein C9374_005690 [Naegleria lovaniensis]|uniref:Uncharacterized protein n=1 Tax=Naegleria lovaniensis TaxID=51637 RepID=A0AA88GPP8_NAELO|nr:uncharacterized protein C9374_005690 [Naegleria lovaniensis]KAG2381898.1 hypothetical protein C9374_005690 [Naegleria lovaniensis]
MLSPGNSNTDIRKSPTLLSATSSAKLPGGGARGAKPVRMASRMLISQKTTTNLHNETAQSVSSDKASQNQSITTSTMGEETRKIIDMLRKEIDSLKYELTNSETEKETYVFQIGEIKKKNRRDLERLEQELQERKEKQLSMEEKLSRVEQIEDAIIKLYLELKDRSYEVVGNAEDIKEIEIREKEELKKENPLVILDRLKANLRTLLVFKDDYENELKDQIRRRKTEAEYKVEELKIKIEQLEKEKEEYKQAAIQAIELKDEAERNQNEQSEVFSEEINNIKNENALLANMIAKKEQDIDKLHEMIDRRDSILRHREVQMMKITQLESKIKNDKTKHQFDINREKSEKYQVLKKYENDINFFQKMENEKKEMENELKRMKDEVRSLKTNASREKVQELTEINQKLQERVNSLSEELKKYQSESRTLKIQVSNLRRSQVEMKQQYLAIFNANIEEKKKRKIQEEANMREQIEKHFHDNAERNPQLASYYKKKLKEKEREVEELNKRLKRMILHQNRESQAEKNFLQEKTQLIGELTQLRRQLPTIIPNDDLSHPSSQAALQQRNLYLEEKLRDYENLQVLSKSQTIAYEKLLSKNNTSMDGDRSFTESSTTDLQASPVNSLLPTSEYTSNRPFSATYGSKKKGVAPLPPGSRPLSAGPRRPVSARVGTSKKALSTLGNLIN